MTEAKKMNLICPNIEAQQLAALIMANFYHQQDTIPEFPPISLNKIIESFDDPLLAAIFLEKIQTIPGIEIIIVE